MLTDEQIDKELKEAIGKYAEKKINRKRAIIFYLLGVFSGIAITLLTILIRQQ